MLIVIVGGGLQGVEVAYLSKKAGFKVMVLDKTPDPPAKGLADDFIQVDVCDHDRAFAYLEKAGIVIPALENDTALEALHLWQKKTTIPLCFDFEAYQTSSSKQKSNHLFSRLDIPKPVDWPQCGFPVVLKPSTGSGSQGVKIISSKEEWTKSGDPSFLKNQMVKEPWVKEEFLEGPSYSLEIIGSNNRYEVLQITELFMDKDYDCKQVMAPVDLDGELITSFENSAKTIAQDMKLEGIMDFEVILDKGEMKMLEIDARFPSQTPMAVYASTGMNMVKILTDLALNKQNSKFFQQKESGAASEHKPEHASKQIPKHIIVEHVLVDFRGISIKGENIMKSCGPLHLETDFFGADEAVTSFTPGVNKWVATLIIKGENQKEVMEKNNQILEGLAHQFNLPLKQDNP